MAALGGVRLFLSEFPLDALGGAEQLTGGEGGLTEDDTIEKLILRLEAPGLGLNERGLAKDLANSQTYQLYGLAKILLPVAEITPKS